jgi:hypothetical protein
MNQSISYIAIAQLSQTEATAQTVSIIIKK